VCHDDSTIIILVIIIITTIIAQHTRGRSQGICISLNQCCCHRRLADDVEGCRSLRKQSIIVLCDEPSVDVTKLELWVPSQVVKELYIGVQANNLSHKRLTALRFYVPLDTEQVISEMFAKPMDWYGKTQPNNKSMLSPIKTNVLQHKTRTWGEAQRDGRPAKSRWRPLFNAAKFG